MKIGDYVRTKKDGIGKITKIEPFMNDTHIFLDSEKGDITFQTKNRVCKVCNEESIIKSSPNIIDLIEVGDYVNGRKIEELYCCAEYEGLGFDESDDSGRNYILLNEIDIKSVVTYEQFESMEYKVGE